MHTSKPTQVWHGGPEVATFANAMALAVGPLLQLALLPFFRTRLGAAGLGLYGLLVVSWGLLSAFEAVVGPGLQRRIARSGRSDATRSIASGIERAAWVVVALTIIGSAALSWYAPQLTFGSSSASVPVLVLAGAIIARLPALLYGILLTALRVPMQLAAWRVAGEVLRIAGAALALYVTSGSVTGFIAWQGIAVGLQAAAGAMLLRRLCPRSPGTTPSSAAPVSTLPLSIRSEIIVALPLLLGLLLAQMDRLALAIAGAWIPLGQYTLAFMLAGAQLFLSTAAVAVVAPHVAAMTGSAIDSLAKTHMNVIRRVALVVGINCGIFAGAATAVAGELLQWFGETADHSTIVLLMASLWAFTANAAVSYAFQLGIAAGEERRVLKFIASVALPYTAAVTIAAAYASAEYMALAWAAINLAWLIEISLIRRHERAELMRIAIRSAIVGIGVGGVIGFGASWFVRAVHGPPTDHWSMAVWLTGMLFAAAAASFATLARQRSNG
jgi:hypothetical protein